MQKPTLSVTLANYNHAHFLPRSLTAITAQSRPPDELILVDDASTDNSVGVMQEYAARHPYIQIIRNEKNLGVIASANKALDRASGDYVHWAAADDYMLPGFIENLMSMIEEHGEVGIASSALASVPDHRDDGWGMEGPPQLNPAAEILLLPGCEEGFHSPDMYRAFIDGTSVSPMETLAPSTFFRTALVKQYGGWPTDLGMHGVSFILRICGLLGGMAYVNAPLYTWIWRQKSITQNELLDLEHLARILRRHAERMRQPPFDTLFSDQFRSRWDATSAELLRPPEPPPPPPPPPSLLRRVLAALTRR